MLRVVQGVQDFFFTIHSNPSHTSLSETFKALNAMRVYSHYDWLVMFCAGEGVVANFKEFLEKNTM